MLDWRTKTDEEIAKFCVAQQGRFESIRKPYEPLYDSSDKLFLPRRAEMQAKRAPGEAHGVGVYDDHPATALGKWANAMSGNMVSREDDGRWWIQFVAQKQALMEIDQIKDYMQESEEQVRFGFNQSTFYDEFPEMLKDTGASYGAMTAEGDKVDDRVVFLTRRPRDHWFGLNRFGKPVADHFKIKMTALDMLKQFTEQALPALIVKQAKAQENLDPFSEHEVLHCIYRNEYRRENSLNKLDKPWIMFYVLPSCQGETGPRLLLKDGSDWGVINLRIGSSLGDAYPLSMALDALTGGCYGNLLAKYKLRAAHLAVDPPRRAHQNLRDQIIRNKLNPGSNTYVESADEVIELLMDRLNWPLSDAELKERNQAIDDIFFLSFFEAFSRGGPDFSKITAYHAAQIAQEKLPMMGPVIDRCQDSVLEPASSVIWTYETLAGRMPDPPDILLEMTGGKIVNRYMGWLAQLRRSIRQSTGTLEILQILEVFSRLWPSSLAKIKHFDFIERACIERGADQDLFHTDQEMEQIEASMEQREQIEMQLAAGERIGKMLPGIGKAFEPGSPGAMMKEAAA